MGLYRRLGVLFLLLQLVQSLMRAGYNTPAVRHAYIDLLEEYRAVAGQMVD